MDKKKKKKRGVYLKNMKQKEKLEEYDPNNGKGLKLQWLNFIKEYIKNGGNATEAYITAYPEVNRESARRNGSRLLTHADIIGEIGNRYDVQTATDAWVIATAMKYAKAGLENPKVALAGVKALEMIARSKGMLTDVQKVEFTAENPAVFFAPYSKEEAEEMDKMFQPKDGKPPIRIIE
ncbi:MAG: terminase small subunit [Candidatus Moraniibacteriota bacterium]